MTCPRSDSHFFVQLTTGHLAHDSSLGGRYPVRTLLRRALHIHPAFGRRTTLQLGFWMEQTNFYTGGTGVYFAHGCCAFCTCALGHVMSCNCIFSDSRPIQTRHFDHVMALDQSQADMKGRLTDVDAPTVLLIPMPFNSLAVGHS